MKIETRYLTATKGNVVGLASRAKLFDGSFSTSSNVFMYDSQADLFSNMLSCDSKFNSMIFAGSNTLVAGGENGHFEIFRYAHQKSDQSPKAITNSETANSAQENPGRDGLSIDNTEKTSISSLSPSHMSPIDDVHSFDTSDASEDPFGLIGKVQSEVMLQAKNICFDDSDLQMSSFYKCTNILSGDVLALDHTIPKNMVVAGSAKSKLVLFNLENPSKAYSTGITVDMGNIENAAFNKRVHHILAISNSDRQIIVLDLRAKKEVVRLNNQSAVKCLRWSPFKATALLYIQDTNLIEFDLSTNEKTIQATAAEHFAIEKHAYIFKSSEVELCDTAFRVLGKCEIDRLYDARISEAAYALSYVDHTEIGKTKRLHLRMGVDCTRKIPFALLGSVVATANHTFRISIETIRSKLLALPANVTQEKTIANETTSPQKGLEAFYKCSSLVYHQAHQTETTVPRESVTTINELICRILSKNIENQQIIDVLLEIFPQKSSESKIRFTTDDSQLIAIIKGTYRKSRNSITFGENHCDSASKMENENTFDDFTDSVTIPLKSLVLLETQKLSEIDLRDITDTRALLIFAALTGNYQFVVENSRTVDWFFIAAWILSIQNVIKQKSIEENVDQQISMKLKEALDGLSSRLYDLNMKNESKLCYLLNENISKFLKIENEEFASMAKTVQISQIHSYMSAFGAIADFHMVHDYKIESDIFPEYLLTKMFIEKRIDSVQNLLNHISLGSVKMQKYPFLSLLPKADNSANMNSIAYDGITSEHQSSLGPKEAALDKIQVSQGGIPTHSHKSMNLNIVGAQSNIESFNTQSHASQTTGSISNSLYTANTPTANPEIVPSGTTPSNPPNITNTCVDASNVVVKKSASSILARSIQANVPNLSNLSLNSSNAFGKEPVSSLPTPSVQPNAPNLPNFSINSSNTFVNTSVSSSSIHKTAYNTANSQVSPQNSLVDLTRHSVLPNLSKTPGEANNGSFGLSQNQSTRPSVLPNMQKISPRVLTDQRSSNISSILPNIPKSSAQPLTNSPLLQNHTINRGLDHAAPPTFDSSGMSSRPHTHPNLHISHGGVGTSNVAPSQVINPNKQLINSNLNSPQTQPPNATTSNKALDRNTYIQSQIGKLMSISNLKTGMLYKTKINASVKKIQHLNTILTSDDPVSQTFKNEMLSILSLIDSIRISDSKVAMTKDDKTNLLSRFKTSLEMLATKLNSEPVQNVVSGTISLMQIAMSDR